MPVGPRHDGSSSAGGLSAVPQLSLPKGGGAIRGVGETFSAQPVTGSAEARVPIGASPGRMGFGPQLSLVYDSSAGLGPFGLGWRLQSSAIIRKTDKILPCYNDSDVFVGVGGDDLVRLTDTPPIPRTLNGHSYQVFEYQPRVEGLHARVERWASLSRAEDVFWRVISRDNQTTWYGRTPESRIFDPADPSRIYSWLTCEIHDDRGNVMVWRYKAEDDRRVDLSATCERNRSGARGTNRYLKRILYGARTPYYPDLGAPAATPVPDDWAFELVFDYGEHDALAPLPVAEANVWPVRPDPFSSYRSGFEVRTYRLCQRVLMFHHFPDEQEVGADCLVRSTEFVYTPLPPPHVEPDGPIYSTLQSITHRSWRRDGAGYRTTALPPVEFTYSTARIDETVRTAALDALPEGVDGVRLQWVDLDGEGLPGVLGEAANGWFYRRNLSAAPAGDGEELARFGPQEAVSPLPAIAELNRGYQHLVDLAGDGQLDLAEFEGPRPGFHERQGDGGWSIFRPFPTLPRIDFSSLDLRFVDLTGDGRADLLVITDEALYWYGSLGEDGFSPRQGLHQALDQEAGPRLVFSSSEVAVFLADMSGDGLSDLVRVRQSEVCYWPNLGYGRFGARVVMDGAPRLGAAFDPRRVRLADIDGSGTSDLIYFGEDGVLIAFNQCGEAWCPPRRLTGLPPLDGVSSATVTDLLGTGTACLVWSSPLPGEACQPMRYVNLMSAPDAGPGRERPVKPHLLIRIDNNLGAETLIDYAPSTRFYLADRQAGRPWTTRLPFPVHVVERVTTIDHVSRNRFTTRYAYHHGHYDGIEREFRGFGMVEQWDSEAFAALSPDGTPPAATPVNEDPAHSVPPILTRTWFHTGQYEQGGPISARFAGEYYREGDASAGLAGLDDQAFSTLLLADTILPDTVLKPDGTRLSHTLTEDEAREACRALKGLILRQEIYGLDSSDASDRPYTISERNYTVELLHPKSTDAHNAVFLVHPRETVDLNYERKLCQVVGDLIVDPDGPPPDDAVIAADPRVSHSLTLEIDTFGNVLQAVSIGYGRRFRDPELEPEDQDRQRRTLATLSENLMTAAVEQPDAHRTPIPCKHWSYELVGLPSPRSGPRLLTLEAVLDALAQAATAPDLSLEDAFNDLPLGATIRRRQLGEARVLFRPDDLGAAAGDRRTLLPLRQMGVRAVQGAGFRLALTPELLAKVFTLEGTPLIPTSGALLGGRGPSDGGYLDLDGDGRWWVPTSREFFHPDPDLTPQQELDAAHAGFFLARRFEDPFGQPSLVAYDTHVLLPVLTTDAVGNTGTAVNDYRVLQPREITDANGNVTAVAFDILGLVAATAVSGKPGEGLGDTLDGFESELTPDELSSFMEDPRSLAATHLGPATSRVIHHPWRFRLSRLAAPDDPIAWKPTVSVSLARETHGPVTPPETLKVQIGFSYSDGLGREVQKKAEARPGPLVSGGSDVPRWTASGWTIFDNKGKPVRQYEPFFTAGPDFEFGVTAGVSSVLFRDPPGRVVAALHPHGGYEKVLFDPWRHSSFDANDTVELDPRTDPDVSARMQAWLTAHPGFQTWLQARAGLAPGSPEAEAASRTRLHAGTPSVAFLDGLGRTVVSLSHNRFVEAGATVNQRHAVRTRYDVAGHVLEVRNERGRAVMRHAYDLAGTEVRQAGMDTGGRWMLSDVLGKPVRVFNSRLYTSRIEYDALRRPVRVFVQGGDPAEPGAELFSSERLHEFTVYGDAPDAGLSKAECKRLNLRGRVLRQADAAGILTNMATDPATGLAEAYDFKGNLLRSEQRLLVDYRVTPDWASVPALLPEGFATSSRYDALDRIVAATGPDGSLYRPSFDAAGQMQRIEVGLRGDPVLTVFVEDIAYDAKGQRTRALWGNGVATTYEYDPLTLRLRRLTTTRPPGQNGLSAKIFQDPATLQDLAYVYDPVGNTLGISDSALRTVLNGQEVSSASTFTYDALYRLVAATGREHAGQSGFLFDLQQSNCRDLPFVGASQLGDPTALRNYVEQYRYDPAGNLTQMAHAAPSGNWTRTYTYEESSQLESGQAADRLSTTRLTNGGVHNEPYGWNAHGAMTSAPHLSMMHWDFRDRLRATARQVRTSAADPAEVEATWNIYDASGQRIRKVTERSDGSIRTERLYLGRFEIFRERAPSGAVRTERETLHVMDGSRRIALVETLTMQGGAQVAAPIPAVRFQLCNQLGSATLELDRAAALITYEEYSPYGATTFQAGRSAAEVSLKRYRHTGRERDEETGFSVHGARYYASWLGRWISADPAGVRDGINLYAYVRGRPMNLVDPSGTAGADPDGVVRTPGTTGASIYYDNNGNARLLPEPETTLANDPAFKDVVREVQEGMRSDSYKSFRSTLNQRIKEILDGNAPHPLKKLLEKKGDTLYWKSGTAYAGQELNYAHTIAQESIKNLGTEAGAAVAPENLSPVGKDFHLKTYGHPEEVATRYMSTASEEAKAATKTAANEAAALRRKSLGRAGGKGGQRGFVSIGGLIFTLVMVGTAVYAVSQARDKTEAIKDLAVNFAFNWAAGRVIGGPATFALGFSSDNPEIARQREEEAAQTEIAKDFMKKHFPDKVKIKPYWFDEYDDVILDQVKRFLFETTPTKLD